MRRRTSSVLRVASAEAETRPPSAVKATFWIGWIAPPPGAVWPKAITPRPVAVSQTFMPPSAPAVARRSPLRREGDRLHRHRRGRSASGPTSPSASETIRAVLSAEPVAMSLPSGLTARARIGPAWPVAIVPLELPFVASQSRTVASSPAVMMTCAVGCDRHRADRALVTRGGRSTWARPASGRACRRPGQGADRGTSRGVRCRRPRPRRCASPVPRGEGRRGPRRRRCAP